MAICHTVPMVSLSVNGGRCQVVGVCDGMGDLVGEAGGEFSLSVSPCSLPGLSCVDTGRGGSSRRPRKPGKIGEGYAGERDKVEEAT
jgi:hypothetical protein